MSIRTRRSGARMGLNMELLPQDQLAQALAKALPEDFSRPALYLFADGGCVYSRDKVTKKTSSSGPGGWGAVLLLIEDDEEPLVSFMRGGHPDSTNNRMELRAIIDGINVVNTMPEIIDGTMRLHVISDSQYAIRGITEWMDGWIRRNFADVKNVSYWQQLLVALKKLSKQQRVTWHHCRGHQNPSQFPAVSWERFTAIGNDAADKLATKGRAELAGKGSR